MIDRNGLNGTNGDQTMRIAINGLGRIGKLVIRAFVDEGLDADIVLLNDVAGKSDLLACLLVAALFCALAWLVSIRLPQTSTKAEVR